MWSVLVRERIVGTHRHLVRKNSSFLDWLLGRNTRNANLEQERHQYGTEATIQLENAFKMYKLESEPASSVTLKKEDAILYYKQMQTIRRMENVASSLYKEKAIRGFCHLYIGQEAIAVGMKAAMRQQDSVITAYRCHGWTYLMGVSVLGILGELLGRKIGCQRGKGGSMHMYTPKFFGGNGIVGAQIPLGVGVALSHQYRGDGGVCVALYGDGAANQGQIFEVYNMSCLWRLPVIYVCENNRYGMGTAAGRASCNTDYYTRGDYVPGLHVNGMNVLAVRSATEYAVAHAVKEGPIVLEMDTYRYGGHSMSDPGTSYRSREEVQDVRAKRDPINAFKELCFEKGFLNEQEAKAIDDKIRAEVDDALKKAKSEGEIEMKELTADVYSANLEPTIRGCSAYNLTHLQINKGINH